jgi:hypothetical protein
VNACSPWIVGCDVNRQALMREEQRQSRFTTLGVVRREPQLNPMAPAARAYSIDWALPAMNRQACPREFNEIKSGGPLKATISRWEFSPFGQMHGLH